MSYQDEFARGFAELTNVAGVPITVDGVSIVAVDDGVSVEQVLTEGGVENRRMLNLTYTAAGRTAPRVGAKVIFKGRTYKVSTYAEDEITYTIKCIDPNWKE